MAGFSETRRSEGPMSPVGGHWRVVPTRDNSLDAAEGKVDVFEGRVG